MSTVVNAGYPAEEKNSARGPLPCDLQGGLTHEKVAEMKKT